MKKLLDLTQLGELAVLVRGLFTDIEKARNSHPLGKHIKRLQVPSILTESIAAHLLNAGYFGVKLRVTPSDTGGDLQIATQAGGVARLEVKGTTEAGFQQFGKRDVEADILVWVHFDDYFWNPAQSEILVLFLAKPGKWFVAKQKITIEKFLEVADDKVHSASVDLDQLLFGAPAGAEDADTVVP